MNSESMKYTCPMHPEIVRDAPGTCPKCGMQLVVASGRISSMSMSGAGAKQSSFKNYMPLIIIITAIILVSLALACTASGGVFAWRNFVAYFMAGFFLVFSLFKLIDLSGFAHGYATYDLLAERLPLYGYVYPFIEFFLGLAIAIGYETPAILWFEILLMVFSGIGVLIKIAQHEEIQCLCLGTILKVPLTTVTLIEDFGMAALGLVLLFAR